MKSTITMTTVAAVTFTVATAARTIMTLGLVALTPQQVQAFSVPTKSHDNTHFSGRDSPFDHLLPHNQQQQHLSVFDGVGSSALLVSLTSQDEVDFSAPTHPSPPPPGTVPKTTESSSLPLSSSTSTLTSTMMTTNYPWQKSPPKKSLSSEGVQQSHTAAPWILNLVEATHYGSVIPTVVIVHSLVANFNFWSSYLDTESHPLQMTMWLLAPVVGNIMIIIPAIVWHQFEDWQVAPTRDGPAVDVYKYNNARLQKIAFDSLFKLITIGNSMMYFGYFGPSGQLLPVAAAAVATACLFDADNTIDRYLPPSNDSNSTFSVPNISVGAFAGQITAFVLKGIVYVDIARHVDDSSLHGINVKISLFVGMLLEMAGGMYEGMVAESTFNQWDHQMAASVMTLGAALEAYAFLSIPNMMTLS